ncbi:AraC family transcriptional regulator [Rhodospirillum rubrum]|uniref:Transcriptional regulator, AraC family n=1 Tax=Rhodospirillum rubrum (strain ATCC 11170 / ATH 1.1.1 / DSM 467 / LMG 4362 / NCIMB 8255 / S1) TaxID=269796 RepID=Q2RPM2_RHORT|nr:helix-turn-helix transcriptional regulator [Rhodospirillum rubrum]ABC23923.1 transcriptional regulator, AraC family [Rhodospirillum rubrum ATCC 11170]AEO49667.1 AraC family transcriptional regulator [Rhodospirillum rubrum F11]MBK5955621.1 AraC family transcriptional regulator [Rhodospirillum rubrum]QXG79867.1 helix-turn-helix transcriptional regulator [Rhodospirillum rubrum]HAP99084.1 AraC family transcriptional regulator [Rhodospirillum rubrum]
MPNLTLPFAFVDVADGPIVIAAAGSQGRELVSPPHHHARGQLFGSTRGLVSVSVEAGVWVVPAIHAVWLPPNHVHWGRSHGPFDGWSVYIAPAACQDLPSSPCTIRTSGLLREAVLRAATWPLEPFVPLDEQKAHVAAVLLDEIRNLPVEPFGLPLPRDPRLERIARALIADPADERDFEAWARWAAISPRSLGRRFVTETGFTFTAWRQRARLMRSLEMLATDLPVTTIALDLGYATASAFISLFRRTFGETPAVYRRRF